jgi:zinc transporter 9
VLLGLIVHAAADGLAVGAAALAREPSVALTVAAAMVLHKAPVAVGLSSYLAASRWPWAATNKALLAFAAASPAAAAATTLLLSPAPAPSGGAGANVALALLLSGGTVLFAAAVHVLPEALAAAGAGHAHADAHPRLHVGKGGPPSEAAEQASHDIGDEEEQRGLLSAPLQRSGSAGGGAGGAEGGRRDVLLWVTGGMLVPLLLSSLIQHDHGHGHSHGHHNL